MSWCSASGAAVAAKPPLRGGAALRHYAAALRCDTTRLRPTLRQLRGFALRGGTTRFRPTLRLRHWAVAPPTPLPLTAA